MSVTKFPRVSRLGLGVAVAIAALAVLPLFSLPGFVFRILAVTFMYVVMAESFNWVGGYAGYVSLGNAAFFGIGAYTTAILLRDYGLSPFLTMFLGAIIAMVLAWGIGLSTLKLRGSYFTLTTLAVTLLLGQMFMGLENLTGGGRGIYNLHARELTPAQEPAAFYLIFLALMIGSIVMSYRIENSCLGLRLMAIRENEDAAVSLGVEATKLKSTVFAISAFFLGVAGGIYSSFLSYVNPDIAYGVLTTVTPVLMAILGGRGTWLGPVIGAFILDLSRQYLSFLIMSELNLLVFGGALIIVILVLPAGLIGFFAKLLRGLRVSARGQESK